MNDRCKDLASPNIANFVISWFVFATSGIRALLNTSSGIVLGILLSYLPQHYKIIARRSSEGLSPYFVLLGTVSGTCAIANILVLPTSREDIYCCSVNRSFSCIAGLLGILQVGIQWSCFFLVSFLFLIFIPREGLALHTLKYPLKPTWREAVTVVAISLFHFIVTFVVSIIIVAKFSKYLQVWANLLGATCAILASIQYIPQIYTTWTMKEASSLSIPMMCIQTPGSFVFAASLAVRLGADGWSAWSVYIVTGILQGCLLIICILFEVHNRRQPKNLSHSREDPLEVSTEISVENVDENSALLRQ